MLILDEPFNGLDPEGIAWIRGFLRGLAAEGRAVLVSSHLMSELQDTAGHLVVVGRGRVLADTSVADLVERASGDRVSVRTESRTEAMAALADAGATVATTDRGTITVSGLPADRVAALLGAARVPFSSVSAHRASLEEAYMELTREAVEYRGRSSGESDDSTRFERLSTSRRSRRPRVTLASGLLCTPNGRSFAPCAAGWSACCWPPDGHPPRGADRQRPAVAPTAPVPGGEEIIGHPSVPIGPDGEAVTDSFQFVHQRLDGDGSITARVADR